MTSPKMTSLLQDKLTDVPGPVTDVSLTFVLWAGALLLVIQVVVVYLRRAVVHVLIHPHRVSVEQTRW